MKILGIESSCDETAAAVVEDGRQVLSSVVASQIDIHAVYGGVVPEIASRAHTEAICGVVESALTQANCTMEDIDAIAVTNAPGLIGALLTGVSFAKGLAFTTKKPLVPVHHIRGHIAANYLVHPDLKPPFIALVVSGGHTSLMRVEDYTDHKLISSTRDDAAGEAFDKCARVLGLPYPGGAAMDKLAAIGDKNKYKLNAGNVDGAPYDFTFSGLKTSVINLVHTELQRGRIMDEEFKADIAASFTNALVKAITARLDLLLSENGGCDIVLAGGVAANSHLREAVKATAEKFGANLYLPPLKLCGDNAAMIAAQGYYEFLAGVRGGTDLNGYATKHC
ncbi:MAG: tRNA (adenosine(37)-N6)-threonylcarbamoyltransferase complex transferase subunit TsaD [Clostridia bacterium]|nr:tRNA (adenosine(37)-N6)-threonylcarbamoyltransferase complex transferase subunit TsaD [Clostridia bacterium]